MRTARSLMDAGDPKGAARHYLAVLRDFPHATAAQAGIAEALGLAELPDLSADVAEPVGRLFARPTEALDDLENRIQGPSADSVGP